MPSCNWCQVKAVRWVAMLAASDVSNGRKIINCTVKLTGVVSVKNAGRVVG